MRMIREYLSQWIRSHSRTIGGRDDPFRQMKFGGRRKEEKGKGRQPKATAASQETFGPETDGKTYHDHSPNDTLARG
jgi:hypothetical protein